MDNKQALHGSTAVPLAEPVVGAAATGHGAKLLSFGSRLVPWAIGIAIWAVIPLTGLVSPALVPSPARVLAKFWELMWQGKLWLDMLLSCGRVLLGLLTGIVLAIPVAFVIGWYKPARRMIDPLINFFRSLPPNLRAPVF